MKENKYEKIYNEYKDVSIIGIIDKDKEEKQYKDTYQVKILEPKNLKDFHILINVSKDNNLQYGDKILVKGEYYKPQGQRNYGGFDYSLYLKTINVCGTINTNSVKILSKNQMPFFLTISNNIKNAINNKIDIIFTKECASILKGILLGNTSYIDEKITENFRTINISHILAVSGMHIAYLILGLKIFFSKLLGKRCTRNYNNYNFAFIYVYYRIFCIYSTCWHYGYFSYFS